MAFSGTVDKCKVCDKTVHVVDMMTLEGVPYHKSCFRCSHCNGMLVMSNYSWMDGILFCKPHFEQLFKETGNFSKNFQTAKPSNKANDLNRTPSKLSSMFTGTLDKCAACDKTVYPLEKVTMEGECYHKTCFRCAHGGCTLTHSSYAALDGVLYCRHHFARLFMEKGDFKHVLESAAHKKSTSNISTPPTEPAEPETADETKQETEEQPQE
ncbi:hypothetical protein MLD38_039005 [Melastoma candidum]|uniref:Uncharacterized protein n=1 Tax=Melastoma candidum TaxID=119954 RepID=A0ACB9L139_9MYRT|nr:hypothetical protein MLD38_039005 [Melastoma candidum]